MADDDVTRLRRAVELVLHDARVSMGVDILGAVFEGDDLPDELALFVPRFDEEVHAYGHVKGEPGGAGIWFHPGSALDEIVVRVADLFQELALERSTEFFGRGFPTCPEHPGGAPLFAELVDGQAMWVCTSGGTTRVRIGQLSAAIYGESASPDDADLP